MDRPDLKFDFPKSQPANIKVIGVGGGGGNAVTHMYNEGIRDVEFVLCNTDYQALEESEVPIKIKRGKEGLGAGNIPEKAKEAAEETLSDLDKVLNDGTKMVFITAGMGGGTGTGAAPVVAKRAKGKGILTVGIVTIPFSWEGKPKILQAIRGVEEMSKNVDALLVINNERLREIYSDLTVLNSFKKADNTLSVAAKSIAEIITIPGHINLDFADVNTTLKDGGVAIMSSGIASGPNRVTQAITNALHSPLLNNNDVFLAKKILINISFSAEFELEMKEMDEINDFMVQFDENINVIWGTAVEEELKESVKITILATGFHITDLPVVSDEMDEEARIAALRQKEAEEKRKKEEADKIAGYYKEKSAEIGKKTRPKPFIFSPAQLNDDSVIETIIDHPVYSRKPGELDGLIKRPEVEFTVNGYSDEENTEKG